MATKASLDEKTVAELRAICKEKQIIGMSKKRKDVIIDTILSGQKAKPASKGGHLSDIRKEAPEGPVTKADFMMSSVMTHPQKKFGDKCTTAITVSCGANSGKFPVVGKTIGAVAEFLREVLNVDRLADGLVNGKKVEGNYVLQSGDNLEFLKPSGRKG